VVERGARQHQLASRPLLSGLSSLIRRGCGEKRGDRGVR